MNCGEFLRFCFSSDARAVLLLLSGIPLSEVPPERICILRCLGSEPRVQSLKVLQCVCCEWVDCRILPFCMVQMLPFSTASEPVNVLVETLQWKVSQCVAVDFSGFVAVQMPGPSCCFFLEYPCQKCLQGIFAFCCVPTHVGI